jgi:HAD superfamily hydrolase (TIGR01509 family)
MLPGARQLLSHLTSISVPWTIATSSRRETATHTLKMLDVPDSVPVVTRDDVAFAKPNPDLFLEAIRRLGADPMDVFVVGDSIWDMLAALRARAIGVGLLSGGYGQDELQTAGAYRVYEDPANLLNHIYELGVRAAAVLCE